MKLRSLTGLAAGLTAVALTAPAAAAPVTVDLRIEGPTRTLFEGPVTTDVRPFRFTGSADAHQCDGTTTGGSQPAPVPTRGAVIAEASERAPFALAGSWHPDFGASFTSIAGESVVFDPATSRYLVEYQNGVFQQLGSCAVEARPGDDVLFAYGTGGEPLLALSGPATARAGERVPVRVVDQKTGAPVAGADVGGARTGADGSAVVGPFASGAADLKASKPGAIRSNRLLVQVAAGAPSGGAAPAPPAATGAPDRRAPIARIAGIREQQRFSRRRAPRELRGVVGADPSGLRAVKLTLTRQVKGKCWLFSGRRERFLDRRCGKRYAFKIGDDPRWSYLLPKRLGRGRYVLDVIAVDRAGNRDELARGRNRIVFHVR